MIISFTGTQSGMTNFQKEELGKTLKLLECTEIINGDCIGADAEAIDIALDNGIKIFTIYPQNKDSKKRAWKFNSGKDITIENGKYWDFEELGLQIKWMPAKPPLERNLLMVDACSILIACPKEHQHSIRSGTWATIRYAWKKEKKDKNFKVIIIPPIVRD